MDKPVSMELGAPTALPLGRMAGDVLALCAGVTALVAWSVGGAGFRVDAVVPWAAMFAFLAAVPAWALGCHRAPHAWVACGARVGLAALFAWAAFRVLPWPAAAVAGLAWQAPLAVALWFAARMVPASRPRRLLVVGAGPEAAAVSASLGRDATMKLVGFYPTTPGATAVPGERLLSSALALAQTTRDLKVSDIVVAVADRRGGGVPQDDLLACRLRGVRVFDLASFFENRRGQVRIDTLRPSWLIYGEGFRQGALRELTKRVFDVVCATALLVGAAPLMVATAALIVLDSSGPVFYRQARVGRGGRVFEVIKFRSMRTDAERDGTPRWASAADSRVTAVGRVIRRFRIDELPQLWNVLAGEMSLIGPRPERPFFVDQLCREVPFYAVRHSVKPGLTGWAQVRYHYGDSLHDAVEKLQYDLYYLKHTSLALDLRILLATVRVVLTGQGAH